MRHCLKQFAVGAAFGLHISCVVADAAPLPPGEVPALWAVVAPEQRQVYERTHQEIAQHWGSLAATKLVFLEGADQVTCNDDPNAKITGNNSVAPLYCAASDTVIISGDYTNVYARQYAQGRSDIQAAGQIYTGAHEMGHAFQHRQDLEPVLIKEETVYDQLDNVRRVQEYELQADCLAGEFMGQHYPGQVPLVAQYLSRFPLDDIAHGEPADRIAAVQRGARGEQC